MAARRTQDWPGEATQTLVRGAGRVALAAAAGAAALIAGSVEALAQEEAVLELGRYCLDADLDRAGPDDDGPGPRVVLLRHGAQEERAVRDHAGVRQLLPCHPDLDRDRLQPGVLRRGAADRRSRPVSPERHGGRYAQGHDPRERVHDLPDDLRHHHACADHRRRRRPHEVLGAALVHRPVERARLSGDRALGLGCRRLDRRPGSARFRRRHGGAHQLRRRRAGRRHRRRQAARLRRRAAWRRTTWSTA